MPTPLSSAPRRRPGKHVFAATTVLLLGACLSSPTAPPPEPPVAVRVVSPRTAPMQQTLRYVGTVRSQREIKLTARVNATVAGLPAAEGVQVSDNAAVVRLSSPETDARVDRAESEAMRGRIEADFACERYSTDVELGAAGALAKQQLDSSQRQCDGAQAVALAADAALREGRALQSYLTERAPFPGIILRHLIEVGEPTQPGKPLLLLGDLRNEVAIQVAEEDLHAGIAVGSPVLLSASGHGEWRSQVRSVAPLAGGAGRTVEVRVPLPEAATGLRHGTSIDANFILQENARAFAVPARAVRREGTTGTVFVATGDHVAAHAVTLGIEVEGWVAVTPALPDGALVAEGDLTLLRDGTYIYPVRGDQVQP